MKKVLLLGAICVSTFSFGQTINLNLAHEYNGLPFAYGTTYAHESGVAVSFTRVQYYLSSFELTHDGAQTTAIPNSYVLASGNVSNYTIGTATVSTIEGINFDLGVDYTSNHMGTSSWSAGQPLAPQSPSMDWGWPSGYFFWVINGMVDDTGNGTPNKAFQMSGIGDPLLRNVDLTGTNITGNTIYMSVNIADWFAGFDMLDIGYEHDGGANNTALGNNTAPETVFTVVSATADNAELEAVQNSIYADYTMPYAPTLYYTFNTQQKVSVNIYDMNGALVLKGQDLDASGNYFIRKELMTGSYIAVFSNEELEERYRFVVQK
jgi:hypothetical protein